MKAIRIDESGGPEVMGSRTSRVPNRALGGARQARRLSV